MATAKASKPYHYIRVSRKMFDDLMVWKLYLESFNGVSCILDKDWVSNVDLQLLKKWHNSDILRDMIFLEMLLIALAICVWHKEFHNKKILFHVDNMAVVFILNSMSTKSDRVLKVLRFICHLLEIFI